MNQKHYDIDEIKDRITIFDVMRHFGHDVADRCKAVKSPLREDNSPSFSIFADGKGAKDHATGIGYDVIKLYQELKGCSRHEAIAGCGSLANLQAGELPPSLHVPPPPRSSVKPKSGSTPSEFREKLGEFDEVRRDQMMEAAILFLKSDKTNILQDFCNLKKLDYKFMAHMVSLGMVGILQHSSVRGGAIAWMFDNPHFGMGCKLRFEAASSHKTMWWKSRSELHLFGEQIVRHSSSAYDDDPKGYIITEGESDALVMLQAGIPALGIVGSQVMPNPRIVHYLLSHRSFGVWYDADKAGREASAKIQQHILKEASGAIACNGVGSKTPDSLDVGDCWIKYGEKFIGYAKSEIDRITTLPQQLKPL